MSQRSSGPCRKWRGATRSFARRSPSSDGVPVQVIHDEPRVPFRTVDLSALSPGEQAEEVRRQAIEEARQVFDLGERTAHSRPPPAPRRRRARAADDAAPHHLRRVGVVDPHPGGRGAVRRLLHGTPASPRNADDSVRGFRVVAAKLAERRGRRGAAGLLEEAAVGHPHAAGAADGSTPTRHADVPRRERGVRVRRRADGAAQGVQRSRGRDAVHDAAVGVRRAVVAIHGADRRGRRQPDCEPQPARDRVADRVLREHPGAARRPGRRTDLPAAGRACASGGASTPTRTRTCPSSSWSRRSSPSGI